MKRSCKTWALAQHSIAKEFKQALYEKTSEQTRPASDVLCLAVEYGKSIVHCGVYVVELRHLGVNAGPQTACKHISRLCKISHACVRWLAMACQLRQEKCPSNRTVRCDTLFNPHQLQGTLARWGRLKNGSGRQPCLANRGAVICWPASQAYPHPNPIPLGSTAAR